MSWSHSQQLSICPLVFGRSLLQVLHLKHSCAAQTVVQTQGKPLPQAAFEVWLESLVILDGFHSMRFRDLMTVVVLMPVTSPWDAPFLLCICWISYYILWLKAIHKEVWPIGRSHKYTGGKSLWNPGVWAMCPQFCFSFLIRCYSCNVSWVHCVAICWHYSTQVTNTGLKWLTFLWLLQFVEL